MIDLVFDMIPNEIDQEPLLDWYNLLPIQIQMQVSGSARC
jgi:hypothetical protein